MFYAKLASDGTVEQYPYTLTDLKRANPHVSFPSVIDEQTISNFGLVSVALTEQLPYVYDKNIVRGVVKNDDDTYTETWTYVDADPAEISERTTNEAAAVRFQRNELLSGSDWTQLPDAPVDSASWAVYRQALRDIPEQAGFPWTITWPTEPA
jgi:hypothetical protein